MKTPGPAMPSNGSPAAHNSSDCSEAAAQRRISPALHRRGQSVTRPHASPMAGRPNRHDSFVLGSAAPAICSQAWLYFCAGPELSILTDVSLVRGCGANQRSTAATVMHSLAPQRSVS